MELTVGKWQKKKKKNITSAHVTKKMSELKFTATTRKTKTFPPLNCTNIVDLCDHSMTINWASQQCHWLKILLPSLSVVHYVFIYTKK